MKHAKLFVSAAMACLALALAACIAPGGGNSSGTGGTAPQSAPAPEPAAEPAPAPEPAAPQAATVTFESVYDRGTEHAVITGFTATGEELWQIKTPTYEAAQLARCSDIGVYEGKYYYAEGGAIKTLSLTDGSLIWENADFSGASVHHVMRADGTLFACGYLGPDLFVVDAQGKTIYRMQHFNEAEHYYWPYKLELTDSAVVITYEMNGKTISVPFADIFAKG